MRATLREPNVVPGVVASIQTFGTWLNFHPHLHLLVTDGAFRSDGTFLHLGFHEIEVLTEAFRRAVLRLVVRRELLSEDELLKRIFEVDPLRCLRCGSDMRFIAFIVDAQVIEAILQHGRRAGRDPRTLSDSDDAFASRAPP